MRILVCGDRAWGDTEFIYNYLSKLVKHNDIDCVIEGDAKGVDRIAGFWARVNKIDNIKYPADWNLGKRAGPIRNREMLKENPDLVIAFHDFIKDSKGTKDMIKAALKKNIKVILVSHEKSAPISS